MAGDWIKMRVWLSRDPRVIGMADNLAMRPGFMSWLTDPVRQSCRESAYEHVTRNVTVALCVTGLLITWGTAREHGDREGDDLVLKHSDLETLNAMTDLPGFGESMAFVGWVAERENGSLVFPKFFRENESPDDRHKRQNAERQARFRDKRDLESNGDVTAKSNVTVTHREEKRREVTPITSRGFDRFWSAYPLRKSKANAEKVWQRIKPNEQLTERILAAVEQAKTSVDWSKDGGRFIPHPATWLNARGWEDEPRPLRVSNGLAI